jgi:hypothetical protein
MGVVEVTPCWALEVLVSWRSVEWVGNVEGSRVGNSRNVVSPDWHKPPLLTPDSAFAAAEPPPPP